MALFVENVVYLNNIEVKKDKTGKWYSKGTAAFLSQRKNKETDTYENEDSFNTRFVCFNEEANKLVGAIRKNEKKAGLLTISGKLFTRHYENEDGSKGAYPELVIFSADAVEKRSKQEPATAPKEDVCPF